MVQVLGATNFPEKIDEAVLSRFQKKIYLKLPDFNAREKLINDELIKRNSQSLLVTEKARIKKIVELTEYYSYREFKHIFEEVDSIILDELSTIQIQELKPGDLRPIRFQDLAKAITNVRPTSTKESIKKYEDFCPTFASVDISKLILTESELNTNKQLGK